MASFQLLTGSVESNKQLQGFQGQARKLEIWAHHWLWLWCADSGKEAEVHPNAIEQ
jgi:hypothetical protein